MDGGSINIGFTGYTIGTPTNSPQDILEKIYSVRDDFTMSFNASWGVTTSRRAASICTGTANGSTGAIAAVACS